MKHTLIAFALLLASCAGSGGSGPSVDGRNFVATSLVLDGVIIDIGARPPTIEFTNGEIGGNNGCNFFGGLADMRPDGTASLEPTMQTEMACQGSDHIEAAFNRALPRVERWSLVDSTLTLSSADGEVMLEMMESPAPIN
jgi:heat shock protein HslJ